MPEESLSAGLTFKIFYDGRYHTIKIIKVCPVTTEYRCWGPVERQFVLITSDSWFEGLFDYRHVLNWYKNSKEVESCQK